MPKVAFMTLGCKVNQYETELMEGLFKKKGYDLVGFNDYADVYVINTCSVTHLGERKSRQHIRRAARKNPLAVIAVTGCYAQISPEDVAKIAGVHVIVGTHERQRIVELVEKAQQDHRQLNIVTDVMKVKEFEDIPLFAMPGRTRAFLKIQEGCTNFCSYCIIPYARGPLRSRPLGSIKEEAERLVKAGFKEIVLTGIHLGAYGRDLEGELTVTDAVKTVLDIAELRRVRLSSLESLEVSPELIALMHRDVRFCRHLHLPLQAGDTRILQAMNRHYTTGEYKSLVDHIKAQVNDIAISADIIVGFPGETDEMFSNALHLVDSINFAKMHIFPYSRRQGTPAAGYPNQIPDEIKKQRVHSMQQLSERKSLEFNRQFLGRTMEVLFETENASFCDGLTTNYIRVYVQADASLLGGIHHVKLEKIYSDGLWGTIIN